MDNTEEKVVGVILTEEGTSEPIKVEKSSTYGENIGVEYAKKDAELTERYERIVGEVIVGVQEHLKKNDEERAKLFLERKAKKENVFSNKRQPIGFGKQQRGGFGKASMRKSSRGR